MIRIVSNTLRCALAVCLLAMSVSPAQAQSPPVPQSPAAPSSDSPFSNPLHFMPRDGEVIYRTSCQACHMAAGQGAIGAGAYPALTKNAKLQSAAYPVYIVVNGSKAMPPFDKLLDDEQVAAVVNYVRTHFRNSYDNHVSANDVKAARR